MESVRLESFAPLAYRTKVPLIFAFIIFTLFDTIVMPAGRVSK